MTSYGSGQAVGVGGEGSGEGTQPSVPGPAAGAAPPPPHADPPSLGTGGGTGAGGSGSAPKVEGGTEESKADVPPPYPFDSTGAAAAHAAAAVHHHHSSYPGYYPPPPPYPPGVTAQHHYWGHPPPPPSSHPADAPPSQAARALDAPAQGEPREGATSPTQMEKTHRDEVQNMGCTCKRTRCLKLYCQCFAIKLHCGTNCRCLSCFNNKDHENERSEAIRLITNRNPAAFDSKFKKGAVEDLSLTHKVGCKCRKSGCLKKYCECYAGNIRCNPNCRCTGCKNLGPNNLGGGHPPGAASISGNKPAGSSSSDMPFPMPMPHPSAVMQTARVLSARKRKAEENAANDGEEPEDATMVAAYAMTEFGQGSAPTSSKKRAAAPSGAEELADGPTASV